MPWRAAGGASLAQRVRLARREVAQDGGAAGSDGRRWCAHCFRRRAFGRACRGRCGGRSIAAADLRRAQRARDGYRACVRRGRRARGSRRRCSATGSISRCGCTARARCGVSCFPPMTLPGIGRSLRCLRACGRPAFRATACSWTTADSRRAGPGRERTPRLG